VTLRVGRFRNEFNQTYKELIDITGEQCLFAKEAGLGADPNPKP
jgi:hypothetical protein